MTKRSNGKEEQGRTALPESLPAHIDGLPVPDESLQAKPGMRTILNLRSRSVLEYIARTVILQNMDYVAAMEQLLHGSPTWKINKAVAEAQESESLKEVIEANLSLAGLDENSKTEFVKTMWAWLRGGSENQQLQAARILGKGFIGERLTSDKPEVLKFAGYDAGIERMLADAPKLEGDNERDIIELERLMGKTGPEPSEPEGVS